jgi:hypothetical protein
MQQHGVLRLGSAACWREARQTGGVNSEPSFERLSDQYVIIQLSFITLR